MVNLIGPSTLTSDYVATIHNNQITCSALVPYSMPVDPTTPSAANGTFAVENYYKVSSESNLIK